MLLTSFMMVIRDCSPASGKILTAIWCGTSNDVQLIKRLIRTRKKFPHLWKDTYPGVLETEDARKRLDGLKSN